MTTRNDFDKAAKKNCDTMTGTSRFPCKFPACSCGAEDRAVAAAKKSTNFREPIRAAQAAA